MNILTNFYKIFMILFALLSPFFFLSVKYLLSKIFILRPKVAINDHLAKMCFLRKEKKKVGGPRTNTQATPKFLA